MNITFVISSLGPGGAERVLSTMANYWCSKGWTVTIITFDDGKESPFYQLDPAIKHYALGISGNSKNFILAMINNIQRVVILRSVIKKLDKVPIITFSDRTNILTLLATWNLGFPVIVSERSNPVLQPLKWPWNLLHKWSYLQAKFVVIQTKRILNFFPPKLQARIRVIPNPINLPNNINLVYQANQVDSKKNGRKILIAMGRFTEEKGFDKLLIAFSKICDRHPDWILEIWGDGPLRSNLEHLIGNLNIGNQVLLPGKTKEPWVQMQRSDLFVLSSRYEGFPNVLLEAMALGLPVISFDCPNGPKDIIQNNINGLLVAPGDVEELSQVMSQLMQDENERYRLSSSAIEVSSRFSIAKTMGLWEALLTQL